MDNNGYILEMDGAKNAGIKGVLYLPKGSYTEPNGSEDYIVKDLLYICEMCWLLNLWRRIYYLFIMLIDIDERSEKYEDRKDLF